MSSDEDAIGQFCGVTGADKSQAKGILEACNWNLELAINMHVDIDDRPSSSSANNSTRPSTASNSATAALNSEKTEPKINLTEEVRPPIAPIRQVLVNTPEPRRYNTRAGSSSAEVYDAFRDFRAEAEWQEQAASNLGNQSEAGGSSPPRTLNDLYRPPLELMCRANFMDAREQSTEKNKWLLVNIQNSREFACQTLNRDVWSNPTVKDIVKEHFIFWQVHFDSYEGQKYTQFYKVRRLPHVCIIDPRTGEELKSWQGNSIDQTSFCDSVVEFLTDHPSPNGSGDTNKIKRICVNQEAKTLYDQSEQDQMEAAIAASLQEATAKPSNEVEEVGIDEDETIDLSDDDEEEEEVVEASECTCKIALRFPDGSSVVQKFSPQQKLSAIRNFVKRNKQGLRADSIEFVAPPNKKLTSESMNETLQDLGLTPASRLEVIYTC